MTFFKNLENAVDSLHGYLCMDPWTQSFACKFRGILHPLVKDIDMYSLMNRRIASPISFSLLNFSFEQLNVSLGGSHKIQIQYTPNLIFHHSLNTCSFPVIFYVTE